MAVEHSYEQDLESSRLYVKAMSAKFGIERLKEMREEGKQLIPSTTVRALNAAIEEEITRLEAEKEQEP